MNDRKINLIWASLMAPYDKVRHASGKIENYFLKYLHNTGDFNIHVISFANKKEEQDLDLDSYKIKNNVFLYEWNIKYKLLNSIGKVNIYSSGAGLTSIFYVNTVLKEMKKLCDAGFIPDIVILDWTEIATGLERVKKLFPNTKIVIIEEDVSFLGHYRKAAAAKGLKHLFLFEKAKRIKIREIDLLNKADLVILNNQKDKNLIIDSIENNDKLWVWCPYYQSMLNYPRKKHNNDIIFYGALSRPENWKTALWFMENVWNKINDQNVRFVMIGNNPPDVLKKYQSDHVVVTGFVDEIYPYFQSALCLVAPLVLGAGVKIKVLEGLSSGIPVLTNDIGIEGIPAKDKKEYFYCVTPEDYIETIKKLLQEKIDFDEIEWNSKKFISDNFNYESDSHIFADKLKALL